MGGKTDEKQLSEFLTWCISRGTSEETCTQYVRYLRKPLDLNNKWSRLAWKAWYKFVGNEEAWKQLKVKRSGVDVYVPEDNEVLGSLRRACSLDSGLCQTYKLLVYSGARLTEVCKALREAKWQDAGGFYKQPLGWFRGAKRSYYIYSLEALDPIVIEDKRVSKAAQKYGLVAPKYIRKWVATKMLSLGMPEEVVNFIQGRVPQEILAKHYLKLSALADQYYKRYVAWLREWLSN